MKQYNKPEVKTTKRATVNFELSVKEFEVVRKALLNYRGKLQFLQSKELGYEELQKINEEAPILESLLKELY